MGVSAPDLAVVVPTRNRAVRLRWLLNALAEQTLPRERWEVVVVHDSTAPGTEELLHTHPLAEAGVLRHLTLAAGSASAGEKRNAGWRAARAPVIAFTDDDCRPPAEWLERALAAASRHPGAIMQGSARPDPDEWVETFGPYTHSQRIDPPTAFAETCNILYPRALLEALGGFVEDPPLAVVEDTELALRARKQLGAELVAAPEVLTYHAIESAPLWRRLRGLWRWSDQPWLVKRHPDAREAYYLWIFWRPTHVWLPFALAGGALSRRNPLWLLLAVPWLVHATPKLENDPRGRIRELSELPGRLLHDTVELAALAWGSIRHRTLFL